LSYTPITESGAKSKFRGLATIRAHVQLSTDVLLLFRPLRAAIPTLGFININHALSVFVINGAEFAGSDHSVVCAFLISRSCHGWFSKDCEQLKNHSKGHTTEAKGTAELRTHYLRTRCA